MIEEPHRKGGGGGGGVGGVPVCIHTERQTADSRGRVGGARRSCPPTGDSNSTRSRFTLLHNFTTKKLAGTLLVISNFHGCLAPQHDDESMVVVGRCSAVDDY
jgi:hypothetical protein